MTDTDLDSVIAAINAAAFRIDNATKCPHCNGEVSLSDDHGRRIIHSLANSGFGADWDAEDVVDLVRHVVAEGGSVRWIRGFDNHDLRVRVAATDKVPRQSVYMFQVPAPEGARS